MAVTDFYHCYLTTVSSIATKIGAALPYYMVQVWAQSILPREPKSVIFNVTRGPPEAVFQGSAVPILVASELTVVK